MDISVVIPAHNEASNLPDCLKGVISQDGVSGTLEVIVVDNASTDNTGEIAIRHGASLVNAPRRGRPQARNAGISVAKGDFLVLLDADCTPQPGWLRGILRGFEDLRVGCVAGEIWNEVADVPLASYMRTKSYLSQAANFRHAFLPYAATGNVAFRKHVFESIGGFDVSLPEGEDADICWRMQLETHYKIKLVQEAAVVHRMEVSARNVFRQKRRHAVGAVMLYKKYRQHWKRDRKGFKSLYWEYRSLVVRAARVAWRRILRRIGVRSGAPLPFDEDQVIFELAWKVGLIEGSIRNRVVYL